MTDLHTSNRFSSPIAISLVLAIVTTGLFWGVQHYDFAPADDQLYVTNNPYVLEGLTLAGMEQAFFHFNIANWSPLTLVSLMIDTSVFGTEPGGYHTTALILHVLNTVLLFVVLFRLTGAQWQSAFVAALFAVHPLHVEAVAWISSRKDVLSALFWILTIGCYLRFVEERTRLRYLILTGMFILGLMAKSILITLPFTLLLLDYWPLKRFGEDYRIGLTRVRELVTEKIPLFILVGVSTVLTYMSSSSGEALRDLAQVPLGLRLQNAPVAYALYVAKSIWPIDLNPAGYPTPKGVPLDILAGAIILLLGITATSIRLRRTAPYLIVGWLWFLGTLVPVIGLVSIGSTLRTDRYMYLPLIGLSIGAVWAVAALARRMSIPRRAVAIAGGVVLVGYAVVSWYQIPHWRDARSMYTQILKNYPDSGRAHYGLAFACAKENDLPVAIEHYVAALKAAPTSVQLHIELGDVLRRSENYSEARKAFRFAILLDSESVSAYWGLGKTEDARGNDAAAEKNYVKALAIQPEHTEIRRALDELRERRPR